MGTPHKTSKGTAPKMSTRANKLIIITQNLKLVR